MAPEHVPVGSTMFTPAIPKATDLINTTDARVWAETFKRQFGHNVVDVETLVGWFANAIEAGRQAGAASL